MGTAPYSGSFAQWEAAHDGNPDDQPPTYAERRAAEAQDRAAARRLERALERGDLVLDPDNPWATPHVPADRLAPGVKVRTRHSGGPWTIVETPDGGRAHAYLLRGRADQRNAVALSEIVEVLP